MAVTAATCIYICVYQHIDIVSPVSRDQRGAFSSAVSPEAPPPSATKQGRCFFFNCEKVQLLFFLALGYPPYLRICADSG
jgi:hypothetical protein